MEEEQNRVIKQMLLIIFTLQSCLHLLDELPENSPFKQQRKLEYNKCLLQLQKFVKSCEIDLNSITAILEGSEQNYIDVVSSIDKFINTIEVKL